MNLSPKYIATFILLAFAMLGWNVFLINRDDKMFKAYYHEKAMQEYCQSLKTWHPDCKKEL